MAKLNVGEVVRLWMDANLSTQEIAKLFRATRTSVWRCLKNNGVDTSKEATRRAVKCGTCGVWFSLARRRARKVNTPFCSKVCYYTWLELGGRHYKPNRHGQRVARMRVIAHYGPLPEGAVVHHKDGDNLNNAPHNLVLFANNGDHVRWHRGIPGVVPLWIGE